MRSLAYTENKKAIRQKWDRRIIARFSQDAGRRLDYFGLPGSEIQDFVDWDEYLAWKTAVEVVDKTGRTEKRSEQLRNVQKLQKNAMLGGYNGTWELRKGQLEKIVLDGADVDGNRPARLRLEKGLPARMTYDLHNWDFQSGLGYKNKQSRSPRVDALKRCFELQKGHAFLLLLTINVRHSLGNEPSAYLNGWADEFQSTAYREILEWYSARSTRDGADHYRMAATVLHLVRQTAHINSFDCFCFPPIYYEGFGGEHLLHFVFSSHPADTVLPSFSKQRFEEVISLPLIDVINGAFQLASEQAPRFDSKRALALLTDLGLPLGDRRQKGPTSVE